jgi:hypothetical protein
MVSLLRDNWSQLSLIRKKLSELLQIRSFIKDFDGEVLNT